MVTFARRAARWAGAHALPVIAGTVVVVGAAGGGIGYEIAGSHTATPASKPIASATTPAARPGATAGAGPQLLQRGLQALATQTGQTPAQVRSELMSGKSLDDIAGSKASAIQASIIAAITKLADKAVAAGRITAAEEATGLATAQTKVTALMGEPGPQALKDVQKLLQFLGKHGHGGAAPSPGPSPAA